MVVGMSVVTATGCTVGTDVGLSVGLSVEMFLGIIMTGKVVGIAVGWLTFGSYVG